MINKGEHLKKEAERLEREASATIDEKRREQLRRLAADLRKQERDWRKPH